MIFISVDFLTLNFRITFAVLICYNYWNEIKLSNTISELGTDPNVEKTRKLDEKAIRLVSTDVTDAFPDLTLSKILF